MPTEPIITIEQIRNAAQRLSQLRSAYAQMLSFYENVFILQEKAKGDIDLEPIQLTPEWQASQQQKNMPLLGVSDFTVDAQVGKQLLYQLCELIESHETDMQASAQAVSMAVAQGKLQSEILFENLLKGNDRFFETSATDTGADKNALAFVAYNSMVPSLELCAGQLSYYLDTAAVWQKGYCPICGSIAGLAVLGEDGKRELVCSFCHHRWRAPRIFCAFCENTQTTQLHYFFAEKEKDLRVDVCDRCQQYIKTVDGRVASRPIYPPLELVASLHLDIIAADKGFKGAVPLNIQS